MPSEMSVAEAISHWGGDLRAAFAIRRSWEDEMDDLRRLATEKKKGEDDWMGPHAPPPVATTTQLRRKSSATAMMNEGGLGALRRKSSATSMTNEGSLGSRSSPRNSPADVLRAARSEQHEAPPPGPAGGRKTTPSFLRAGVPTPPSRDTATPCAKCGTVSPRSSPRSLHVASPGASAASSPSPSPRSPHVRAADASAALAMQRANSPRTSRLQRATATTAAAKMGAHGLLNKAAGAVGGAVGRILDAATLRSSQTCAPNTGSGVEPANPSPLSARAHGHSGAQYGRTNGSSPLPRRSETEQGGGEAAAASSTSSPEPTTSRKRNSLSNIALDRKSSLVDCRARASSTLIDHDEFAAAMKAQMCSEHDDSDEDDIDDTYANRGRGVTYCAGNSPGSNASGGSHPTDRPTRAADQTAVVRQAAEPAARRRNSITGDDVALSEEGRMKRRNSVTEDFVLRLDALEASTAAAQAQDQQPKPRESHRAAARHGSRGSASSDAHAGSANDVSERISDRFSERRRSADNRVTISSHSRNSSDAPAMATAAHSTSAGGDAAQALRRALSERRPSLAPTPDLPPQAPPQAPHERRKQSVVFRSDVESGTGSARKEQRRKEVMKLHTAFLEQQQGKSGAKGHQQGHQHAAHQQGGGPRNVMKAHTFEAVLKLYYPHAGRDEVAEMVEWVSTRKGERIEEGRSSTGIFESETGMQQNEIRQLFASYSRDKKVVTLADLLEGWKDTGIDTAEVADIFHKLDDDGNGTLDLEEFTKLVSECNVHGDDSFTVSTISRSPHRKSLSITPSGGGVNMCASPRRPQASPSTSCNGGV